MFEKIQQINELRLLYLNSLSTNNTIETIVGIFADAPIFFIPVFLLVTWIILSCRKKTEEKENLLFIFYSCVLGIIIALIIQQIIHFDRPENYIKNTGKLLLSHIPDASFPSDHATVSFAFLTSLYFANYKKIFIMFLPFAIIMGLSRIIAGVHWPFDIITGTMIGITSSVIIFKFVKKLEITKKINTLIIKIASFIKL
ncbi:phosphatase PAP2 family protein [Candidatus Gracilibacteria bacterium]|nr:phosphatase PAP2 family protein [Candidatus Gracilibacteria bacterium]